MIQITPQMRILVCLESIDFRKGIDGLWGVCRRQLEYAVERQISRRYDRKKGLRERCEAHKKAMAAYEAMIKRLPGLEKWFVEIVPCCKHF